MKKIIFGIFAHPDDEAFGPSGTFLLETRAGTDLHLITLTAGENGNNPDNEENLGEVRLREWQAAGTLMGATTMHHLGFTDGTINNHAFLDLSKKLETIVRDIASRQTVPVEIELVSRAHKGISGNIATLVASRSAGVVWSTLKEDVSPRRRT